MSKPPDNPKIYHITHVDNLSGIVTDQRIWSDMQRLGQELNAELVGLTNIKRRRLEDIEVTCHSGNRVGDYVPFYFCPRSIMLYILYRGNHPGLSYRGGQEPIIHLRADLNTVIQWARENRCQWAISDRNAGTYVAEFFKKTDDLNKLDWQAIASTDFRSSEIREGKQAEFLMHESFPWELVEQIGVFDSGIKARVEEAIASTVHKPLVNVRREWYYCTQRAEQ